MAKHLIQIDPAFHWLDLVDPSMKEMKAIAQQYGLHPTSVEDCLDPTHLPKHERIGGITFLIIRAYDESSDNDADTVQELTRKIAIFVGQDFILTVHRKDQPFISAFRAKWGNPESACTRTKPGFLYDLLETTVYTYEKPIDDAINGFESLEERIFQPNPPQGVIEEGYYLKRKASVFKRMLRMTTDLFPKISAFQEANAPLFQNLKEGSDSLFFYADELLENLNNLLTLHVSLASQRTNEVVRVLTIFSVFFMPLNLIAGIYGMNFEHMPELTHPFGYLGVLIGMTLVTTTIYVWFKKKGWLKS